MISPASTQFRIDPQDYLAFCRLTYWRSILRCLWPAIVVLVLIAGGLVITGSDLLDAIMPVLVGILTAGLFVAFNYVFLLPSRAKRNFRESASLQDTMTFTPNETGFVCDQPSGTWHPKWADMRKWEETNRLLVIFPNRTAVGPGRFRKCPANSARESWSSPRTTRAS